MQTVQAEPDSPQKVKSPKGLQQPSQKSQAWLWLNNNFEKTPTVLEIASSWDDVNRVVVTEFDKRKTS